MSNVKSLFNFFFKVFKRAKIREVYEINDEQLSEMLHQNSNLSFAWLWDRKYKYPDFESMMKVIKYDMVKWQEYRAEHYDCDNFAISYAGMVAFTYGINNVGIVIGRVVDEQGRVGYHVWNVFIAQKANGEPELYIYEPQAGLFSTYKSGRIGSWRYEPIYVIWA